MPAERHSNSLIAYIRTQEEQADRAGVKFLTATGQSPKGMYDTFKRLADETLYQGPHGIDPYLQTHPMPTVSGTSQALPEELIKTSPYWNKNDPPGLKLRHDLMRAKLYGFMDRADISGNRYGAVDQGLPARYARAIAAYRYYSIRAEPRRRRSMR